MAGTSDENAGLGPQLPCDGEGVCMKCKAKPVEGEKLNCKTCVTPWHVECLARKPESLSDVEKWECPDCTMEDMVAPATEGRELVAAMMAIEGDKTLSDAEKARKKQALMSGKNGEQSEAEERGDAMSKDNEILNILGDNIKCSFCMKLPDRPVTTPCGHNFCLKCFEKWTRGQGKGTCAKCRNSIPDKFIEQPRINASLVFAIRAARTHKPVSAAAPRVFHSVRNEDLPDAAFTTERAVKSGKANAKSGRIFVTIPNEHLGPITAEYDPEKKTGVLVGDCWEDRFACRQWGAHFPLVSGIAGQSKVGAQSIVLSGGYIDDEDHGEWFIYTGSGGRDLKTGNKRTSKEQTCHQKFTKGNESLRQSCRKGYPVRVIRSHKEKRSNYAPETGVRYDGIYRIEKCWIKQQTLIDENGVKSKGYNVCRYLFVRCDNSPAPWSSDENGDRPRPLPAVGELNESFQITERKEKAHWDFDEKEGCWKWMMPPPPIKAKGKGAGARSNKRSKAKILKGFSCLICHKVLTLPVTTPCAHNFCKSCLDGAFKGQKFEREIETGGRQLRTRKTVMKCPSCTMNIADFLQNAQVNRELMGVIESLTQKLEEEEKAAAGDEEESSDDVEEDEEEEDEDEEVNEDAAGEVDEKSVPNSNETEGKPVKVEPKSQGTNDGVNPTVAKRGRKRKNADAAAVPAGVKVATNDGDKPSAAKRGRGRPRKSAGAGTVAKPVADDGNDSPSSPLHVSAEHDLES